MIVTVTKHNRSLMSQTHREVNRSCPADKRESVAAGARLDEGERCWVEGLRGPGAAAAPDAGRGRMKSSRETTLSLDG